MNVRTADISKMLSRFLERYTPPQAIRDKPNLMQDEAEGLLRTLLKFAPQYDYAGWISAALDQLEYQMKTRSWPTKHELGAVCSNLRKERPVENLVAKEQKKPLDFVAARMNKGDPVGQEWLYGRNAVELEDSGLVSAETFKAYRSGLFFQMKDVWQHEGALRTEAELKRKHEEARYA